MTMQRRSRMKRQPTGKRVELSPRDLAIFELLTRYRYLRSTYIHAFVGGASETRFKERLGDLYHEGGYLERPKRQWDCVNARYMPLVYENTLKAVEVLHALGGVVETIPSKKSDRQFAHRLLTCEVLASIELAVRHYPGLRIISSSEILAKAPQHAAEALNPLALPVSVGRGRSNLVVPDALFGLEYAEGGQKSYRFFALEVDRGTMPVRRNRHGQTSYADKMEAYRRALALSAHKTYWGIPNLFVLTVTTSPHRMEHMLAALAGAATGSKIFLFKNLKSLGLLEGKGRPVKGMLDEPWERAAQPPFPIALP